MSVSATNVPDMLRVAYSCKISDKSEYEVVCYVRPIDTGVEINYSHHIQRTRYAATSPWMENSTKLDLTPPLLGQIELCVMLEIWGRFERKVQPMSDRIEPAEITMLHRESGAPRE